ncbi:SBBP repeat-containing protein [Cytophagaceae bacterium YF14B1]|uniref:SBBP repeat-containing protein n=1 Tax=Xanthocytophaga flava TaxID=3048013 RepID=A0AAE3U5I0_9BACT|nr:SBBP repeat-containing protein [Xanthocytophaga flavus]MDJ1479552.1 SBBP repeat-containing protein [Xanthocytophaga flavus]
MKAIVTDKSGNIYCAGEFYGTGGFSSPSDNTDISIIKYSPTGQLLWTKQVGSLGMDMATDLDIDQQGNIYVTGMFSETIVLGAFSLVSKGAKDIFIAKFSTEGEVQWAIQAGGINTETVQNITVTRSGDIFITGGFSGEITLGTTTLIAKEDSDMFFAKITSVGEIQWAKSANGAFGQNIATDNNGNIYISGRISSPKSTFDNIILNYSDQQKTLFIAKYSDQGKIIWAKNMGGYFSLNGNRMSIDNTGNLYLTGFFFETAVFDNKLLTHEGGSLFVLKCTSSGEIKWVKSAEGIGYCYGFGIALDNLGNPYITGSFDNTIKLGNQSFTSQGANDIFISKYNTNGQILWTKTAGGTERDQGLNLAIDQSNNVCLIGSSLKSITLDQTTLNSPNGTTIIWKTRH